MSFGAGYDARRPDGLCIPPHRPSPRRIEAVIVGRATAPDGPASTPSSLADHCLGSMLPSDSSPLAIYPPLVYRPISCP